MDAMCPCYRSRYINSKVLRKDFFAKSGISMFIPDVLFDRFRSSPRTGSGASLRRPNHGDHVNQISPITRRSCAAHSLKFGVNYSRRHFSTNTTNRWTAASISTLA